MNKVSVFVMMALFAMCKLGNEKIRLALDSVMRINFPANSDEELMAEKWGLPQSLFASPSFENLVTVVRSEIGNCQAQFACGLTNRVSRKVFIEAVIRCGQAAYRNAVTNWFGGEVAASASLEVMEGFASAARTSMEGYFIDHYDEPGISNVWINIRSRYLAIGNTNEVIGIDYILNGRSKAVREMLKRLE